MKEKIIAAEKNRLILVNDNGDHRLPYVDELDFTETCDVFHFGNFKAIPRDAVNLDDSGSQFEQWGLRESWAVLREEDYQAASKGVELLNWNAEERYCCRDGALLERFSEISKKCPECGSEYFPRLSPAIVVLVKKDDKALLVHARTLRGDVMALVAGFVETGESLEECVRREVMEETSLEIDDIRYYGSQSWPFPHQLMIGFTAKWKSGEVKFADGELTAGGFFSRRNPPVIPSMPSLTRMMIDKWLEGKL